MTSQVLSISAIAVYMAAVIAVGLLGWRLARVGDMFNIFGRKAHAVRAAASYMGLIGAGELITFSQLGYDNGFDVLWLLGGFATGFVILLLLSDVVRRAAQERQINTLVGYFRDTFGLPASIGLTFVSMASLGSLLIIQFVLGSDLIASVTGISPNLAAALIGLVIASYLIPSGIVAVLSTDVLRAVMMTAILVIVIFVTVISIPNFHLHGLNVANLGPVDRGSFFVLGIFGTFCGADVWQTVLASENTRVVRRSLFAAAIGFVSIGTLIAFIGMLTKFKVPLIADGTPAFLVAIHSVIPEIISPLTAVLITGSVMATADTEIWVISSLLLSNALPSAASTGESSNDIFQARVKQLTQIVIPLVIVVAVVLAHLSRSAQALYQGLLILLTVLGPSHIAIVFAKPKPLAIAVSIWAGIAAFFGASWHFNFAIPTEWSLAPLAISVAGYFVGQALGAPPRSRV